jgi:ribonuclease VapC
MSKCVLDASALLALLYGESGSVQVAEAIDDGAVISQVNVSEVVAKLNEGGYADEIIREMINPIGIEAIDFDAKLAFEAGLLRSLTKSAGLSFGDRACLALAKRLKLPAMTTDRAWENVPAEVGVQVIRITR